MLRQPWRRSAHPSRSSFLPNCACLVQYSSSIDQWNSEERRASRNTRRKFHCWVHHIKTYHFFQLMWCRERREHCIYTELLNTVPGLEERLVTRTEDEIVVVAELVRIYPWSALSYCIFLLQIRKGASGARGDDTKSLKGAILEWITPKGQVLNPALSRNGKVDRGFHHERTGALLCPTGLDWANQEYMCGLIIRGHKLTCLQY